MKIVSCVLVSNSIRMYHIDANKTQREKLDGKLHKNTTSYLKQILEATPTKQQLCNNTCETLLENQEQTLNDVLL